MKLQRQVTITLNKPCTEDFTAMSATACGKFCNSCQKEVVDFSILSDVELLQWLRKYPNSCGMFREDQLGRPITEMIKNTANRSWSAWVAILSIAFFFGVGDLQAQTKTAAGTGQLRETKENEADSIAKPVDQIPVRTTDNIAPNYDGGYRTASDGLKIGGARTDNTIYIIDGVQPVGREKRGFFRWLVRWTKFIRI